ncbi:MULTISPECIES: GTPase domain-containing protein [unclassified Candidatus Frackibacter]|uniref:GTPase domain-containing protein n=1 Tax=unclassified Candidatus Frackibacter TaxID=2648818 RepID=UPI000792FFEF|nr:MULTISPECIES: GTPase domain-containing protein [unclassified Candidatus Frackibacter]KXS41769.1 MAG: GTP-binding protein HSR1-like protein [Candidatus Frackibacter sp. T328-2]SDC26806.1 small GTP-binding protein domain-containing protein [Candidatus Frackibacter sp. WG11]SEM53815.1 small GTP-binding protein domain-containing protein [Candidatus Frackibacter sp. WG12]SFL54657.1 small GTP-binding protein domain-containing protein [Candidatus Frackibacter sp. WG13]
MTKSLVIGQTNVGKTCFAINFADYLGIKELKFTIRQPAGFLSKQTYELQTALKELVCPEEHTTKEIQEIQLKLPAGKGYQRVNLIDSCGLIEGIHPQEEIRLAMAQTLRKIQESNIILHLIDLSKLNTRRLKELPELDLEIYNYCKTKKCYAILANKIDLKIARNNLEFLQERLGHEIIIPISALYQQGFKEVKKFLLKNL